MDDTKLSSARDVRNALAQDGLGKLPGLDARAIEKLKKDALEKAEKLRRNVCKICCRGP